MLSKTDSSKILSKYSRNSDSDGASSPLILGLFAFSVIATGILAAIFGYKFGHARGYQVSQNEFNEQGKAQAISSDELVELNKKVEDLNTRLDATRAERDITLNNLDTMRGSIESYKVENLQLENLNDVLGETIAAKGGLPLQVIGANIQPLPENAFEYRFDVAMLAKDNREHRLDPKLTLLNEESLVEVPLEPRYYDLKGVSRIRGRFTMPEGFKPKQAQLVLKADGQTVEQIYDWQLAGPVDKMPLSLADAPDADQRPISEQ